MLGPLELRVAGSPAALGGERQQKLLAVLLLNAGAVVSFDRLAAELWDEPPVTARRQVTNAASAVRRVLAAAGQDRLITTTHGYRLQTSGDLVDADTFRTLVRQVTAEPGRARQSVDLLEEALGLWRGPLLDGLSSASISVAREAMAEQRLAAVERLARLRLELGDAASMVGELLEAVIEHPLRESLRAVLMRALHQAGRQGDALAVFEDGRRLLAEELGVDPGPELCLLHEQMLRSDPALKVSAAESVGHFLPYDIPDFIGRAAELDRMVAAITQSPAEAQVILAVEGMGGVGKTALAVHLAHRLLGSYPDGRYFVDLRGHTEGEEPMPVDAALDALLWQAGVPPNQIPTELDARCARWRERTAGRRVLVVLDNAADAAQVRPLLPGGPGGLVLVTSRRQLVNLEGAVPLTLEVLNADTAADLFQCIAATDRVAAEPEATRAVLRLCGGLPLAVRIAASRLRRRPSWTMAHLAEQLGNRLGRHRMLAVDGHSVSGVIALSYHHLTAVRQRLFRLLGLIPGYDFDANAAAALAQLAVTDAEDALEGLLERNLLLQQNPGRYCLHDLVRDCARGLAVEPEDEPSQARHRLFDYYLELVAVHSAPITMGKPRFTPELRHQPSVPRPLSQEQALRVLDTEHRNLVAAANYASTHRWLRHAWQLPCLLLPYFVRVGHRTGLPALADNAMDAARELGDQRGMALSLQASAYALSEQARTTEVLDLLERSIAISAKLGDLPLLEGGQRDLGIALLQVGRLTEAARCFASAREAARAMNDVNNEVNSTINLALVDCQLGRHDEARELFEQALGHHQRAGSAEGQAITLINIGWIDHLQDRDNRALDYLDRAVRLSRTIGFVRGEVIALSWLAVSYRGLGRLDDAIAAGQAARAAARRVELHDPECDALNGLAEAYLAAGRSAEARETFLEAERVALAGDLPMALGRAWEGLAHVAQAAAEYEQARSLWERALTSYPGDVLEARHPRDHLAAVGDPTVRCGRCRTSPVAISSRVGERGLKPRR